MRLFKKKATAPEHPLNAVMAQLPPKVPSKPPPKISGNTPRKSCDEKLRFTGASPKRPGAIWRDDLERHTSAKKVNVNPLQLAPRDHHHHRVPEPELQAEVDQEDSCCAEMPGAFPCSP
ncbi:hypothetical protein FKW77_001028 [Venturia effusa]|uniref:Uncharacterized protein n=1 Tax=Venturia effusa TaxID=50376 RepID=A0A517L8K1_9PEZI|nr:hypothetical protein FKW77_001028 [Venturia effusa]